jgi:C_GCAxxG_C_C family probable redox protein
VERALRLQQDGHNCAQAAACAFIQYLPIEENLLYRLSEGFGGGMGGYDGTCGAMSGCILAISLLRSGGAPTHITKAETYALVKRLARQ